MFRFSAGSLRLISLFPTLLPLFANHLHAINRFLASPSKPLFRSRAEARDFALQDFFSVSRHRTRRRCRPLTSTASRKFAIARLSITARATNRTTLSRVTSSRSLLRVLIIGNVTTALRTFATGQTRWTRANRARRTRGTLIK